MPILSRARSLNSTTNATVAAVITLVAIREGILINLQVGVDKHGLPAWISEA
jgi:hypothetical protein